MQPGQDYRSTEQSQPPSSTAVGATAFAYSPQPSASGLLPSPVAGPASYAPSPLQSSPASVTALVDACGDDLSAVAVVHDGCSAAPLPGADPTGSGSQRTNVYIAWLPRSFSEDDLIRLVAPFGPIASLRLVQDASRSYAFVLYHNRNDAERALALLNTMRFSGRRLQARISNAHDGARVAAAGPARVAPVAPVAAMQTATATWAMAGPPPAASPPIMFAFPPPAPGQSLPLTAAPAFVPAPPPPSYSIPLGLGDATRVAAAPHFAQIAPSPPPYGTYLPAMLPARDIPQPPTAAILAPMPHTMLQAAPPVVWVEGQPFLVAPAAPFAGAPISFEPPLADPHLAASDASRAGFHHGRAW